MSGIKLAREYVEQPSPRLSVQPSRILLPSRQRLGTQLMGDIPAGAYPEDNRVEHVLTGGMAFLDV